MCLRLSFVLVVGPSFFLSYSLYLLNLSVTNDTIYCSTYAMLQGLKLGRKKRDPVKDIDEWTKMRDIAKNLRSKGILIRDM